jgi:hypothetical protein
MNVISISLCNPETITDIEEMREALNRANSQIMDLGHQLDALTRSTHQLTTEMAVMCEAYLAGDTPLVVNKVRGFATHYQRHVRPLAGGVH